MVDNQPVTGEVGEWVVDHDDQWVHITFTHVMNSGVETFETSMPPEHALRFAEGITNVAHDMQEPS